MPKAEDLSGKKYGFLTAVYIDHVGNGGHAYWKCDCDCGKSKIVKASHLKSGNVTSCGCYKPRMTHGFSNSRVYTIWHNMRQRCLNPNNNSFPLYGGRGIKVCDDWMNFDTFRRWAFSNGYKENLSIDRIDVNGNYEPSNCRWATQREQANNTRKTRFLTYKGETHSVSEWARLKNIKQSTLNMRLNRYMWSVEDALGKEVSKNVS